MTDPIDDLETSRELAVLIARAADEKKAEDVVVLDVHAVLAICDYFVLCSAGNPRLVGAIAEEIEEQTWLGTDRKPISVEGLDERRWVLLDYGDVVVHVFLDVERDYYRLDRLYGDVARIGWNPGVSPSPSDDAAAGT